MLKFQDRNKIQEYLEDSLSGHSPKLLKGASLGLMGAVRNFILSPIFIPVKGNPTSKVVIEVDVRPNTHHCGTTIFWVWAGGKSKLQTKNDGKKYYLREGTSTRQINMNNMSEKKELKYLEAAVKKNSEVLQSWEEGTRALSSLRQVRLGTIRTSGEILTKVNIVREAYLQGVIDMRSDNHVMRSISTCIKSCDMRLDKITGSMLATLVKVLQKSDSHSKGASKIIENDNVVKSSETKSRKAPFLDKSQEFIVNDSISDENDGGEENGAQSWSESRKLMNNNRKALLSTKLLNSPLVPPQVQLRHPKLTFQSMWKRITPHEQVEYKKKVDTSGKDTIIYDPTEHGQFKDWIGSTPSQIRRNDGIKAVRVIRPGLSKQEVKPLSDRDLEKVVKEFKKQRAKGDKNITVGFLKRLGEKHGFTTGQYQLSHQIHYIYALKIIISPSLLQESGWS